MCYNMQFFFLYSRARCLFYNSLHGRGGRRPHQYRNTSYNIVGTHVQKHPLSSPGLLFSSKTNIARFFPRQNRSQPLSLGRENQNSPRSCGPYIPIFIHFKAVWIADAYFASSVISLLVSPSICKDTRAFLPFHQACARIHFEHGPVRVLGVAI